MGRPRAVELRAASILGAVSVAARNGHVVLAWSMGEPANRRGVEAAAGRWNEPLDAQRMTSTRAGVGPVAVTVAGDGSASPFWTTLKFACESCNGEADQLLVSDGP